MASKSVLWSVFAHIRNVSENDDMDIDKPDSVNSTIPGIDDISYGGH
jgi:hypothetical protein